jgi:predicted  nucleic acid-binding Zn-ribbon protein
MMSDADNRQDEIITMRLDRIESRLEMLEEKLRTERCELSGKIADIKTDLRQEINGMHAEIRNIQAELHSEIMDVRDETSAEKNRRLAAKLDLFMILWVFFCVVTIITIFSLS